jgi:hypothetical protein
MLKINASEDLEMLQHYWQLYWPQTCLFDLWPVRVCFQEQFNRRPFFLIAEQNGKPQGLLALSWIEEKQYLGHFPGETCQGKTWLEQNRIWAGSPEVFRELVGHIPDTADIRYLMRESLPADGPTPEIDEIGYLFYPGQHNYDYLTYQQQFSGKSRKNLRRELALLEAHGVSFRYNAPADLEYMFAMNQNNFGEASYFSDARFLNAFTSLVGWLKDRGFLRVTTLMLGGKIAAIDIGAVWGRGYTLLAGATHPDFPGVAKLINFHHIEWACRQHFEVVDFLCGDFGWKERFHLVPRPLYKLQLQSVPGRLPAETAHRGVAGA